MAGTQGNEGSFVVKSDKTTKAMSKVDGGKTFESVAEAEATG
jgi:hypothetical protein